MRSIDPGLVSLAPRPTPPPQIQLSWTVDVGERTTAVALAGELDLAVADLARGALVRSWRMHGRRVEVDLTGITFIDSVGLRGVLQAFDQIAAAGGAASITAASPGARRVFELSGLGAMLA